MSALFESIISNPFASLGLLSLLIPLLIHLFNPNRGKIILVGNLQLINKVKNKKVTEIKIRQWLLLIMRLIFFLLLTFLLLNVLFPSATNTGKNESVFVSRFWLKQATNNDKETLQKKHKDSLIYVMKPGFDLVTDFSKIDNQSATTFSLNSLISEANSKNFLSQRNIIYFDSYSDFFSEKLNPSLLTGRSDIKLDGIAITKMTEEQNEFLINLFYTKDRIEDYQQLKAVFDSFSKIVPSFSVSYFPLPQSSLTFIPEEQADWYIWLSSEPIAESIEKKVRLGSFALRDSIEDLSDKVLRPISFVGMNLDFYHPLISTDEVDGVSIWNSPLYSVLSYQTLNKGKLFHFHSRFNSNWNNLSDGSNLLVVVNELLSLIQQSKGQTISSATFTDLGSDPQTIKNVSPTIYQNYREYLILALVLLWFLERILSETKAYRHD